ncbi:MAG: hypothetical protein C0599_02390 [Salinivirgaceae bacterium]|nr:MAG: hypothetical protein C0599_02390 [Salinivirgaceae bacterium]
MSFTLFLSLFAIGAGLGLLIREIFNFELPMPRYLSGVFLLLLGIHFMIIQLGKTTDSETYTVVFNERNFSYNSNISNEYVVVFGASRINLENLDLNNESKSIEIDVVFGHADVVLPDSIPYIIESNIAFGGTDGNGPNNGGIGDFTTYSNEFSSDSIYLTIRANVSFGSITWR